jgi:hypothetical protein
MHAKIGTPTAPPATHAMFIWRLALPAGKSNTSTPMHHCQLAVQHLRRRSHQPRCRNHLHLELLLMRQECGAPTEASCHLQPHDGFSLGRAPPHGLPWTLRNSHPSAQKRRRQGYREPPRDPLAYAGAHFASQCLLCRATVSGSAPTTSGSASASARTPDLNCRQLHINHRSCPRPATPCLAARMLTKMHMLRLCNFRCIASAAGNQVGLSAAGQSSHVRPKPPVAAPQSSGNSAVQSSSAGCARAEQVRRQRRGPAAVQGKGVHTALGVAGFL